MKQLATYAGVVLAICGTPALAQQSHPPKSIFGVYGRSGRGRDSIRVTSRERDKVNVALKLYFASGHTCQLDQEASWQGDRLLVIADGVNPNQACKLEARFSPRRIRLTDEGQHCAQVYCGTRGKLDGVVLLKTRR